MLLNAIKKTWATQEGKKALLFMVLSLVILLLIGKIPMNLGKWNFIIYMIPAMASVFFGDQFVRIATHFMEEELDKYDREHKLGKYKK